MRFSSFVTSTLLVAAGASERSTTPLADRDLPWDELRNQLSTEATLLATTNQNYFEDCYPEFQILPVSKRSNYRLIDAPSGICTDQIAPGYVLCLCRFVIVIVIAARTPYSVQFQTPFSILFAYI